MGAPTRAQIQINALNRLVKEHGLYVEELKENESKLAQLTAAKAEEAEIKQQQKIVAETKAILPRVRSSIESELESVREIKSGDEVSQAEEAAAAAEEYLRK